MPFKSEKQRGFMWVHHPDIAKRWTSEQKAKTHKSKTDAAINYRQMK